MVVHAFENPISTAKYAQCIAGLERALALTRKYKVKAALGTDMLFDPALAAKEGKFLAKMKKWYPPMKLPRDPYPGELGVVKEGALADLLVGEGNPLKNLDLVSRAIGPATSYAAGRLRRPGSISSVLWDTISPVKVLTKTAAGSEQMFFDVWAVSLFKSLNVTGDLADALRRAGYDSERPVRKYPAQVFLKMADVVRQHLFPDLSVSEGYRRMGRRQLVGYFETTMGKIVSKAFPLLGPERLIRGLESYTTIGNNFLKVKAFKAADRHWGLTHRHVCGTPPDFSAGAVEHIFDMARVPSRKVVVAHSDAAKDEFDLEITW